MRASKRLNHCTISLDLYLSILNSKIRIPEKLPVEEKNILNTDCKYVYV